MGTRERRPRRAPPEPTTQTTSNKLAAPADGEREPPRRRKRLSADLPQHWLDDPVFLCLSHEAWRLWTGMLMWAIGRTDGEIPLVALSRLMPGSDEDRATAAKELIDAGKVVQTPTGWQIPRWSEHQSTVEQIETRRAYERRKKASKAAGSPGGIPQGTPTGEYGTARHGVLTSANNGENSNEEEQPRQVLTSANNHGDGGSCRICGELLGEQYIRLGRTTHPTCRVRTGGDLR